MLRIYYHTLIAFRYKNRSITFFSIYINKPIPSSQILGLCEFSGHGPFPFLTWMHNN